MAKPAIAYGRKVCSHFCDLLSQSEKSATKIVEENPDLPDMRTLLRWRDRYPAFDRMWKRAREIQAEHLMQKCFDLAASADKTNAHAVRVKFDIYKFNASKILPAIYGDKPSETNVSVQTAVVIGPERLEQIRANLERARAQFSEKPDALTKRKEVHSRYPESLVEYDRKHSVNGDSTESSEQPNEDSRE